MSGANDDLLGNLTRMTGENLATMIVCMIELAARTHPEEMRKALAQVFDLAAIRQESRLTLALCREASDIAHEVRAEIAELVRCIHKDLSDIEQRMEAYGYESQTLSMQPKEE